MTLVHIQSKKSLPGLTFVLGGAASGKSTIAELLIENSGLSKKYIATSRIWDKETQNRVDVHIARRDADWTTIEAPINLAEALSECCAESAVLVDCATMWLTNLMMDERDMTAACDALFETIQSCPARVVVVSNEVGQGIVPDNALARRFRDAQGRFNMAMAEKAQVVVHVVAGLPVLLKGTLK